MSDVRLRTLAGLLAPAAQPMGPQGLLARLALSEPPTPEAMLPPRPGYTEARNATPLQPQGVGEIGRSYLAQMAGVEPAGVAANTIMGFTGPATVNARNVLQGIRAFHGSPHRFDRFDMSRIGTGEGAQAYGHGLYFAGNEDVARSYRSAGVPNYIGDDRATMARQLLQAAGGDRAAAIAAADARMRATTRYGEGRLYQDVVNNFDELVGRGPGSMYEVNLRVDPNRLLDWDAPLAQQPQAVQQGVRDAAAAYRENYAGRSRPMTTDDVLAGRIDNYRGEDGLAAAGGFAPGATGARASTLLRDAGVQGIRYLDGGSRAAGEGSRNYVMFDDSLVDIVRRYGLAGLLAGGGAAAATGGAEAAAP